MTLSEEARELLRETYMLGAATIFADDILPCAELLRAGLVEARDNDDGPWVFLSEKGKSEFFTRATENVANAGTNRGTFRPGAKRSDCE